jgi:hypothetical protein
MLGSKAISITCQAWYFAVGKKLNGANRGTSAGVTAAAKGRGLGLGCNGCAVAAGPDGAGIVVADPRVGQQDLRPFGNGSRRFYNSTEGLETAVCRGGRTARWHEQPSVEPRSAACPLSAAARLGRVPSLYDLIVLTTP